MLLLINSMNFKNRLTELKQSKNSANDKNPKPWQGQVSYIVS